MELSSSMASTAAQARLLRPLSCCRPGPGLAGKRSVDRRLHLPCSNPPTSRSCAFGSLAPTCFAWLGKKTVDWFLG